MFDRETARGVAKRRCRTLVHSCLIAAALLGGAAVPPGSEAQEASIEFNIAAQLLESALVQFGAQARVQIAAADGDVSGLKTDGVTGRRAVEEALAQLLRGTGLEYRKINERTYRVSRPMRSATGELDQQLPQHRVAEDGVASVEGATIAAPASTAGLAIEDGVAKAADTRAASALEEIIVTGTHIRGTAPVGTRLITIGRDEIEATGLTSVQDVLKTIPQNFAGGVSEDTAISPTRLSREASTNSSFASSPNLRGLGPAATLTLVNGRRLAGGGTRGAFTDVSGIPLTAIERVEVLPDGASALYGSDAIGGVVNLVLRRDYQGAETSAHWGSVTDGDMQELQVGQVLGHTWNSGHALLALEYRDRDELPMADRELAASSDLRRFGGDNFDRIAGNPATIQIGTQSWAVPAGQDGSSLTPASFVPGTVNLHNLNESRNLLPEQTRWGAALVAEQAIADNFHVFVDGLFSRRAVEGQTNRSASVLTVPRSNAFYVNPTGGNAALRVNYGFLDDLGPNRTRHTVKNGSGTLGVKMDFLRDWRAETSVSYGRETELQFQSVLNNTALAAALADSNRITALNVFGDGSFTNPATLAAIAGTFRFEKTTEMRTATSIASGPILRVGDSDIKVALGLEYREETLKTASQAPGAAARAAQYDRAIRAAFGELVIPVFGAERSSPGLRRLELSLAGRLEDYGDFGNTTVPKAGITWTPTSFLSLRAAWSRAFKAPNLAELDEVGGTASTLRSGVRDPQAPMGTSTVLNWDGNNADLQPEEATVWTAGVSLAPESLPAWSFDLGYFRIEAQDRIETTAFPADVLENPRFSPIVTRNPSAELRDEVCSRGRFIGVAADCRNAPIAALVDTRLNNIAITEISGFDLSGDYRLESRAGAFRFGANATYTREYSQARLQTLPLDDVVDTENNPLRLRSRASLRWSRGGASASAFVNFTGAYQDITSVPSRRVGSWTTVDAQLGFDFGGDASPGSWLEGTAVSVTGQNVFDEDPPFLNSSRGVGYDQDNADLIGRFLSLRLRKEW